MKNFFLVIIMVVMAFIMALFFGCNANEDVNKDVEQSDLIDNKNQNEDNSNENNENNNENINHNENNDQSKDEIKDSNLENENNNDDSEKNNNDDNVQPNEEVEFVHNDIYKSIDLSDDITYFRSGDRVCLLLSMVRLTNGQGDEFVKYYDEKYDEKKHTYTITYDSGMGDITEGKYIINDEYLNGITVFKESNKISIVFNATRNFVYTTSRRKYLEVNDSAVTILMPPPEEEKLVVISPGHGGREPGAVREGFCEKDFNLDICLAMEAYLKENGVKTYMLRHEDCFIGLYERSLISNALGADMFVSVHNNTFEQESVHGSVVLCVPGQIKNDGLTGMELAKNISEAIDVLSTRNNGYAFREDLSVLNGTIMPAALIELAFMTNTEDFGRLKDSNFIREAGEAIGKGVIKSLQKVQ